MQVCAGMVFTQLSGFLVRRSRRCQDAACILPVSHAGLTLASALPKHVLQLLRGLAACVRNCQKILLVWKTIVVLARWTAQK